VREVIKSDSVDEDTRTPTAQSKLRKSPTNKEENTAHPLSAGPRLIPPHLDGRCCPSLARYGKYSKALDHTSIG
jgi:hypothetical protein